LPRSLIFVVGALLLFTSGCTAPESTPLPIVCSEIREDSLRALGFGKMTPEQVITWQTEGQLARRLNVRVYGPDLVSWTRANKRYEAHFQGGLLRRVDVRWQSAAPTIADALNCFGSPDYYTVQWGSGAGPALDIALWYVRDGVTVGDWQEVRDVSAPRVTNTDRLNSVSYLEAGDPRQMIRYSYLVGEDAAFQKQILDRMKPWPGSFPAIEIPAFPH
jgi:hypothetical protein